jgi:hypothetical protein
MSYGITKTNHAALGVRIAAHILASHPEVKCLSAVLTAQRGGTLAQSGPRWLASLRAEMDSAR